MDWQTIDSAPKDGTEVVIARWVWNEGGNYTYPLQRRAFFSCGLWSGGVWSPTHWHLPAPTVEPADADV